MNTYLVDVYVPQKMITEFNTYYPEFYLDNDTNWYDFKFEEFASKKIHIIQIYVPQKMITEFNTYYPEFYLDNDTNW